MRRLKVCTPLVALVLTLSTRLGAAEGRELCVFVTQGGRVQQVNSRDLVPPEFRASARCFSEKSGQNKEQSFVPEIGQEHRAPSATSGVAGLALPQEVNLDGNIRRVSMASSVGRIELRWPRRVEELFGRTPERAMADAARAVSRALKSKGFPGQVQTLDLDWQVVFMDELAPSAQIPQYLVSNCHPGWMTPPTNIYIVANRVAAGCGGARRGVGDADAELAKVLVHELGHGVEFQMLRDRFSGDRLRSEGFATWFQMTASEYSGVIPRGTVRAELADWAQRAITSSPTQFTFSGSAGDYARAAFIFDAVVDRRGVAGINEVYQRMGTERSDFLTALTRELSWSRQRLFEETARAAGREG